MGTTAIAAIAFLAGAVFSQCWPLFVRWIDGRSAVTVEVTHPNPYVSVNTAIASTKRPSDADASPSSPTNTHRRMGLAERRRMAEMQSLKAPTYQAEVTANNARALS